MKSKQVFETCQECGNDTYCEIKYRFNWRKFKLVKKVICSWCVFGVLRRGK